MNNQQFAPPPVIRELRFVNKDESDYVIHTTLGDVLNLTTGDLQVARVIDGRRWDTKDAVLVAGFGSGTLITTIRRLYRISRHEYFTLGFEWDHETRELVGPTIDPVDYLDVFERVKPLVHKADLATFLRRWHLTEWLPHDFGAAEEWAEQELTADEYDQLFRPAPPPVEPSKSEEESKAFV